MEKIIDFSYSQWMKAVKKWRKIIKFIYNGEFAQVVMFARDTSCSYCEHKPYKGCGKCPLIKQDICYRNFYKRQRSGEPYVFWCFIKSCAGHKQGKALIEANQIFDAIWKDGIRLGHVK